MYLVFIGVSKLLLWIAFLYLAHRWQNNSKFGSNLMLFGPRYLIPQSLKEKSRQHRGVATLTNILIFAIGIFILVLALLYIFASFFIASDFVNFSVCKISGGDYSFWINICNNGVLYELGIN